MTLNKFCPVAQGEYYNIKSPDKSQLFFTFFSFLFTCFAISLQVQPKNAIYCMQNNYEPQYVVIAQTKEKTLKKLEKSVDFFVGICYYNTRLERQGKTY